MGALCTLVRRLIITAIVGAVVIGGLFFISGQVQLSNRQAQIAAEKTETCYRWAHRHKPPTVQERLDDLIGLAPGDCQ